MTQMNLILISIYIYDRFFNKIKSLKPFNIVRITYKN